MKNYYDFEHDIYLSDEELEKEYINLKEDGEIEDVTFSQYLANCMYYNNGTLVATNSKEYERLMEEQ